MYSIPRGPPRLSVATRGGNQGRSPDTRHRTFFGQRRQPTGGGGGVRTLHDSGFTVIARPPSRLWTLLEGYTGWVGVGPLRCPASPSRQSCHPSCSAGKRFNDPTAFAEREIDGSVGADDTGRQFGPGLGPTRRGWGVVGTAEGWVCRG